MLIFCSKRNTFETANWSSAVDENLKVPRGYQPSHAQPLPLWHVLLLAMHESPQALPFLQTLQQPLASWSPSILIGSKPLNTFDSSVSASSQETESTWTGICTSWSVSLACRSAAEIETQKTKDKHKNKTFERPSNRQARRAGRDGPRKDWSKD